MEGLGLIFDGLAIAIESLATATCTALYVAAFDMELTFDNAAVVARPHIRTPILLFLTVADAWYFLAIHFAGLDFLRLDNLFGPSFNHRYAAEHDFWLWRVQSKAPRGCETRLGGLVVKRNVVLFAAAGYEA